MVMKRKTCISNQSKHQYSLVLSLVGVMGLMSLILPIGRAGPEDISPRAPVATVGVSRFAEHAPTLLEPDQATQAGRRPLQRPKNRGLRNRGLESAPTGLGLDAQERTQAIDQASAGQVVPEDSEVDEALLSVQQNRATYRYDDLNRLIEVVYEDGTRISYTYDAAGNLMQTVTKPR
jgi:YD repeat-containing protein